MPPKSEDKPKTYYQIQLLNVLGSLEEKISDICFENGALGVSENIPLSDETLDQPILIPSKTKKFDVYFETQPSKEFFEEISQFVALENIKGSELENKDWLEEWKKGYHAFSLIHNIWVVPSWEKAPENTNPIYIDPGMAFGTGTHQTTQVCAELIFPIVAKNKTKSMIDVGTGTGILAMLAHKMGVSKIVGTEIDHESVVTANENLAINKIDAIKVYETELSKITETFDLIVANIIDSVLLDLKADLLKISNPQSALILSGILEERDEEFIRAFLSETSLKVEKRIQKDEWIGYHLTYAPVLDQ